MFLQSIKTFKSDVYRINETYCRKIEAPPTAAQRLQAAGTSAATTALDALGMGLANVLEGAVYAPLAVVFGRGVATSWLADPTPKERAQEDWDLRKYGAINMVPSACLGLATLAITPLAATGAALLGAQLGYRVMPLSMFLLGRKIEAVHNAAMNGHPTTEPALAFPYRRGFA